MGGGWTTNGYGRDWKRKATASTTSTTSTQGNIQTRGALLVESSRPGGFWHAGMSKGLRGLPLVCLRTDLFIAKRV